MLPDHLDDDALVALSLRASGDGASAGSTDPDAGRAHLRGCAACRRELARLERVVAAARVDVPGEELPVPAGTWAAIAAATGVEGRADPLPPGPPPQRGPRRDRRPRPLLALAAAAAVGAVLAAGAVSALTDDGGPGRPVATAVLAPVETGSAPAAATGAASVREGTTGRQLVVSVEDLGGAGGGFREVWLLDPDGGGLLSLGVLDGVGGTFAVPAALDLVEYSVVDVSAEPLDGDPAHSSDSLLRGSLAPRA